MTIEDTGWDLYPKGTEDWIKIGEIDGVALRFYLAGQLAKMRYGERVAIPHKIVNKAWPPTGDHDTSFEGSFRAMALAFGGLRPETSYTTQERIERDLDETFRVERMYYENDQRWLIERKLRCCPQCHGDGYFEEWDFGPERMSPMEIGEVVTEMTVAKKRFKCDHAPDGKRSRRSPALDELGKLDGELMERGGE